MVKSKCRTFKDEMSTLNFSVDTYPNIEFNLDVDRCLFSYHW